MDVVFHPAAGSPFSIEVGFFDTILEIKEKIQKYQSIPVDSQTLIMNAQILQNDLDVHHYQILNDTHIHIAPAATLQGLPESPKKDEKSSSSEQKSPPPGPGVSDARQMPPPPPHRLVPTPVSRRVKLKVKMQMMCGKTIRVEVNPFENVRDLRQQVEDLQQPLDFRVPAEGYFFIHKQAVMDDNLTFRWHCVEQGDTIEIFRGYVTGGSS